jgi:hypothetical protein
VGRMGDQVQFVGEAEEALLGRSARFASPIFTNTNELVQMFTAARIAAPSLVDCRGAPGLPTEAVAELLA